MKASNTGIGVIDRLAIMAIFAAAILILTMVELTARSSMPALPVAALMAMSTHVDLPMFTVRHHKAVAARAGGRR